MKKAPRRGAFLFMLGGFPELGGSHAADAFEPVGKIGGVCKAALPGDGLDRKLCFCQQLSGFFNSEDLDVFHDGESCLLFEFPAEIGLVIAKPGA